ncbi:MAG: hypothetical protein V1696_01010 [Candidatus Jorgensenbacteria bacterium]
MSKKQTTPLEQYAGHLQSVMSYLSKGFTERGINTVELLAKAAQPESEPALDEIIEVCAGLMVGARELALKHPALIEPRIIIATPAFSKAQFFGSQMGVGISMGTNFENWVLSEVSDEVPASQGLVLASLDLSQQMRDTEIRGEIGADNPLTPDQWAQALYFNLTRQPNGEKGYFKTNDFFSNLSYLKLRGGEIVAAGAYWDPDDRVWGLGADRLDADPWGVGDRVFPAAPTV